MCKWFRTTNLEEMITYRVLNRFNYTNMALKTLNLAFKTPNVAFKTSNLAFKMSNLAFKTLLALFI